MDSLQNILSNLYLIGLIKKYIIIQTIGIIDINIEKNCIEKESDLFDISLLTHKIDQNHINTMVKKTEYTIISIGFPVNISNNEFIFIN
jgi:hypothetical protein